MNAPSRVPLPEIGTQAAGRWPGLLARLAGLSAAHLSGKNCPCPMCGGRDRFRFMDTNGHGTWICNACGSGDGMKLLMLKLSLPFKDAAAAVRGIVGEVQPTRARRQIDDGRARRLYRDLWLRSRPIGDDEAAAYLRSRDILPPYPAALRFCPDAEVKDHPVRATLPAMLARVSGPDGAAVNIHRTYLENGRKAEWADPETGVIASSRKMMPGKVPDGSAIRLGEAGERLGVAEGIETAMRASDRFEMPVWSCINSTMLAKFVPPAGTDELHIFGDNDLKFGGQAAAYSLAHRVATRPGAPQVFVHLPKVAGTDWADAEAGDARG